jgi:hypothetical protein
VTGPENRVDIMSKLVAGRSPHHAAQFALENHLVFLCFVGLNGPSPAPSGSPFTAGKSECILTSSKS